MVVLTNDASDPDRFWLNRDYLPEHNDLWAGRPSLTELASAIAARTEPVPIPWDCADGFYEAYWRRAEAYGRWAERNRDLLDLDAAELDSRLLIA